MTDRQREIYETLQEQGNVRATARELGVTRGTIYKCMERHGWENPETDYVPGSKESVKDV